MGNAAQGHASTTDPEAQLFGKVKGKEAKLCYMGHVLMENRHGLIITPRLTAATGTAERDMAERLVGYLPGRHRITNSLTYKGMTCKLLVSREAKA
jgi:hypothetical protein